MNKVALIIGNAAYPESKLANPVNDAIAIDEKLSHLGFETIMRTDATNQAMDEALAEFSSELSTHDVALFFFAGHGMQIAGKNYLTAIDTDFHQEIPAKHSSLPLDKVIETMENGSNKTNIIILDACRTNPYERRWRGADSSGLAPVYAPKGMIIGYATSPGQVAHDGNGRNGAYTDAFLRHVSTPDITIEDLFKRIRNTLSSSTRGRQISWEHTSLMGDFYFNYSIVTDELVAEYEESAIADADYQPISGEMAREIIGSLKSHNWYKQNPAITKITKPNLSTFTKNDLFVLGRNIYQSACGGSSVAENYLSNLQDRQTFIGESTFFHVLNGILFEIYFDSNGCFRSSPKAQMIDAVFGIEESELFKDSFRFAKQALTPYIKNLFYIPLSARGISFDVVCGEKGEGIAEVESIFFEGDNVLYDSSGEHYFDPSKEYSHLLGERTRDDIRDNLSKASAVPSYRLKVSFVGLSDDIEEVLAPHNMIIKRLAH
jgi:hypothetical protein